MNIVVTGSEGAVGTPLVAELVSRGHHVTTLDLMHTNRPFHTRCDVGEYRQLWRAIPENTELVFHLAAEFGRHNGEDYYEQLWRTNAVGTKNILRLQENRRFRLVMFSSSEVYGMEPHLLQEGICGNSAPRQMNDYAMSKWVNEMQVMASEDRFHTETVRVRLFNVYGPGEPYSPYRSAVCQFIYKALHGISYVVYHGYYRTPVYISDAVRTLANIPEKFFPGSVYNISGKALYGMKEISNEVLRQLGKDDSQVEYLDIDPLNSVMKHASCVLAEKEIDHHPEVSLSDGIAETISWQRQVYDR